MIRADPDIYMHAVGLHVYFVVHKHVNTKPGIKLLAKR